MAHSFALVLQDPGKVIESSKDFGPNMYLVIVVIVGVGLLIFWILRFNKHRDDREQSRMDRMVVVAEKQSEAITGIASTMKSLDEEIQRRRKTQRK
jgi:ABC-type bacteriocin/lantibiotic exporter with double-glycine peptidase domain